MSQIGCGILVAGPVIGTPSKGEAREFCGNGRLCAVCQDKQELYDRLEAARKDSARIDIMDKHGWNLIDQGDQVSLFGMLPIREAIDEYCKRHGVG